MALIKCKYCEEEVSDRAPFCPHCGGKLIEEAATEIKPVLCEDCGTEIIAGASFCSKCGCPVPAVKQNADEAQQKVEITNVNVPKMAAKKKKVIIGVIAAVVIIAIIAVMSTGINKKNRAAEYIENYRLATYTMLEGAADAETAGNLTVAVWQNAIYEKTDETTDKYTKPNGYFVDDFNDALSNLFSDSEFASNTSSIQSNQSEVAALMKTLTNPPEEYEEAYEALKELYEVYLDMTNMAVSPTGSLNSFSSDFNTADSSFMTCYNKVNLYLD